MALDKNEQMLVESFREYLAKQSDKFLPTSDDKATNDNNFKTRGFEYHHRQINEMFALRIADLVHHDGICAAFSKVHNYKYLDDPTFSEALKAEFSSQAIPVAEQKTAFEAIPKIIKELSTESKEWAERDSGWHQDLDDVTNAGLGDLNGKQ